VRLGPPNEAPGRAAGLLGTLAVHAAAVAFLMAAVKPTKASPPSYAVDLVAAPAPTTKQRLAREALPTPPPEEKPAPPPPKPLRSLAAPAVGAPIAYDVGRAGASEETSVPPASGLPLADPSGDTAPTF